MERIGRGGGAEDLLYYDGPDQVVSCYEVRADTPEKLPWVLWSGFDTLDDLLRGFGPGEVTVISGVTGEGKTLFCQSLTRNFYAKAYKCMWFSYEVRPFLFFPSFGAVLPDFYMPKKMAGNTVEWVYDRILEGKLKYQVQAVFIDHLHYLLDMGSRVNMSLHIGDIMRKLVNLAHDLEIHLFLVAHMAKVPIEKEPGKGDARDSSFVEQEASNTFYLWRTSRGGTLKIAKNRRMGVYNVKISLTKNGNYFEEADAQG